MMPVCLAIILAHRQGAEMRGAIVDPRLVGRLLSSALLIGSDRRIFLLAINSGQAVGTSISIR
jgi:chloramphenicol-sensitive protein RarD